MAEYNPNSPAILGQEWVPIRNENLIFDEATGSFEVGHTFTLGANTQVNQARFYINDPAYGIFVNHGFTASIYEKGQEALSGPVKKVTIPCNAGAVTGDVETFLGVAVTDAQIPALLSNPGTIRFDGIWLNLLSGFTGFRTYYAVDQYAQALFGKRILGTTIVVQYYVDRIINGPEDESTLSDQELTFSLHNDITGAIAQLYQFTPLVKGQFPPLDSRITRRDRFGNTSQFFGYPSSDDTFPITFDELRRFEATYGPGRVFPVIAANWSGQSAPRIAVMYMALEVYYCEETRVAYGTKIYNSSYVPFGNEDRYRTNLNQIQMRTLAGAANPVLTPGDYTLTITQANFGTEFEVLRAPEPHPVLTAARELYPIPGIEGVRINLPTVIDDTAIDEVFTKEDVRTLPQLSLHLSGGAPITDVHVYGKQARAEIWGNYVAEQELANDVDPTFSYPWVRFYARRFGDTSNNLLFSGNGAFSGSSVSISPAELDALDEIADGWKEVTLRFDTPPLLGSAAFPTFDFTTDEDIPGNRWEVLGASAPAISGMPGFMWNLAPAVQQLYTATYEAPTGATQELIWYPQGVGSPPITGTGVADDSSDIVVLFAQDPPTVTGFTLTGKCQPLTGIGQQCDVDPCCVPTSIAFHQLSWSPESTAESPLGYSYELQRMDEIEDWQTIMLMPVDLGVGMLLEDGQGEYASTPDTAVLDITGDLDIRADATTDAWVAGVPSGANDYLVGKYDSNTNQRSYVLRISSAGTLQLLWSTNGTTVQTRSATVDPNPGPTGRLAVRATLDVDNGAAGHTVTFYTASTIAGPWTQLGDAVVTAGTTSIFSGPATMIVGAIDEGTAGFMPGIIHAAQVRNGIAGTIVANPDFTIQPEGTTTFVDSAGRTWTLQSGASIVQNTTTFNDFEARVGLDSSYRIRIVDDYGFYGSWSNELTGAIPNPGVEIGCHGGHLLIFTSNERQDGSANLAYSSVWMDERVNETFNFPEAGFVQMQPMYNRDYFTAFRPLERGGEQFQRTILVQAAAISPPTLADFRSMRDLCWEPLNYICVRDEDSNRWLATVQMPTGVVLNNRRLYMATIQIAEVTDVPTPVAPDEDITFLEGEFCDSFDCSEVEASDSFSRVVSDGWGSTS